MKVGLACGLRVKTDVAHAKGERLSSTMCTRHRHTVVTQSKWQCAIPSTTAKLPQPWGTRFNGTKMKVIADISSNSEQTTQGCLCTCDAVLCIDQELCAAALYPVGMSFQAGNTCSSLSRGSRHDFVKVLHPEGVGQPTVKA